MREIFVCHPLYAAVYRSKWIKRRIRQR